MTERAPVPAVVLDRLTKFYGEIEAVASVSLTVGKGEYVALIGPSGCGKTTTLRMTAGLIAPTSGTIVIDGRRVDRLPANRRGLGMVFQGFALFPHLNVEDNVAFGLKMQGINRPARMRRAREMLDLVGLAGLGASRVDRLSGGQKQRVGLARALVTQPSVLLLDEPLGALDAQLRGELQSELRRLHDQLGITFVHVTHDQNEAFALADRIAVMNLGRIEQIASPEAIFAAPATRFVAAFVGRNNLFDGRVTRLEGDRVVIRTDVGELQAPLNGIPPAAGDAVTLVVRADRIREVTSATNDVDTVFQGTLRGLTFAGSRAKLVVAVGPGTTVLLDEHEDIARQRQVVTGAAMTIGWAARDVRLLA